MDTTQTGTPAFVADCGHTIPALPAGHVGGTVYAVQRSSLGDVRICYACAAEHERERMTEDGRAVLYVTQDRVNGGHTVTDWAGKLAFRAFNVTRSEGRTPCGKRYPIVTGRFTGPDGRLWAFRNVGDNEIACCRRLKDAR